ncbi:alpha/beta hydrolase family protein [Brevibacterium zhoupengii]|uniref:alpha/beta hydrolase family protein n=1 Tax=Brevibacterium zhoupengii TaxID=2898795 RepID=UPI001E4F283F|nr:alpha/beta hydrolase [Brevibacterium zhoupengii]
MNTEELGAQRSLSYGNDKDQVFDLWLPIGSYIRGIAVLVHGGYWRQRLDRSLMAPMAELLVAEGWAIANVEYRRGPDSPWPIPSSDLRTAAQKVRAVAAAESISGPFVFIGHSVGGQLCLLNSDYSDALVALAPVTDTARVYAERLGDGAAHEYFQRSPHEAPDVYQNSSPICCAPPEVPTLLVQGNNDDRVPPEHTARFADMVRPTTFVDLHCFDQVGHIELIRADSEHWVSTLRWMNALTL